jgi:hypothetical protein
MESDAIDRDDVAAQLATLQGDRAVLGDRVLQPWWYDVVHVVLVVLVVLVPAFVLAQGFDQHWVMVVAGAVLGVAVAMLSRLWGRAYAARLRAER